MGFVGRLAWQRTRRRGGRLLLLTAVGAMAAGTTIAATTAARDASTALERALEKAEFADVSVDVPVVDPEHVAAIEAIEGVERTWAYGFVAMRPRGSDVRAGIEMVAVAPFDRHAGQTGDVPRIHRGRLPDPARVDEVVMNTALAARLGVEVGDRVVLDAYRQTEIDALFSQPDEVEPHGATIAATVVGIGEPLDSIGSGGGGEFGIVQLSPAAWAQHGGGPPDFRDFEAALARDGALGVFRLVLRADLADDSAGATAFLDRAAEVFDGQVDTTFSETADDVFLASRDTIDVETIALIALAAAVTIASLAVLGQLAARDATTAVDAEGAALRALGARTIDLAGAALLPAVVATTVGGIAGAIGAWIASSSLPPGLAGVIDPSRSRRIDVVVVVVTLAVFASVVGASAALGAARALRTKLDAPVVRSSHGLVAHPVVRLAVAIAGHARTRRVLGRPATLGLMATVLAGAGALTFVSSADHLGETPRLYGDAWDLQVLFQVDGEELASGARGDLVGDERLAGVTEFAAFEVGFEGESPQGGTALDPVKGAVLPPIVRGRLPVGADEIAVSVGGPFGSSALGRVIHAQVGEATVPFTIVGVIPHGAAVGDIVVTQDAIATLEPDVSDAGFYLDVADDHDIGELQGELRERFAEVDPPLAPAAVSNIAGVRRFPMLLAAFLGLLGLASLAHLVITAVGSRRASLSIGRALGMTPRQVFFVGQVVAAIVAAGALVVGVPLGVAAGRTAWVAIAEGLGVLPAPAVAMPVLLLVIAGALALALLIALTPSLRAASRQPARDLRVE